LERGELVCEALEAYREWQPNKALDFDQAVLLVKALVHAKFVTLALCRHCDSVMLIDQMGQQSANCDRCQQAALSISSCKRAKSDMRTQICVKTTDPACDAE
jgi:hypothetical protein